VAFQYFISGSHFQQRKKKEIDNKNKLNCLSVTRKTTNEKTCIYIVWGYACNAMRMWPVIM